MAKTSSSAGLSKLLPVLFGFFVMGFVDVIGVATNYLKDPVAEGGFGWSGTLAGFLGSAIFIWFLILSVPAAIAMNKLGRKRMVQISNVVTILGMAVPFIAFNPITCIIGFAMLGAGNTILQVSLNPLMTNVVSGERLSSALTAGQLVKALSSFCGPILAVFLSSKLGSWSYIFPVYGAATLLAAFWLQVTAIPKEEKVSQTTSLGKTFSLLGDKTILLLFLGIVFVVGVDVGMNILSPALLKERVASLSLLSDTKLASSVYFIFRTAGAFAGAFLLTKLADVKYFRIHIIAALACLGILAFMKTEITVLLFIGLVGFTCASIFSVIYSQALRARPDKANEISGLMITGVCGGGLVSPLMGSVSDAMGTQIGSLLVIGIFICYLIFCSLMLKMDKK